MTRVRDHEVVKLVLSMTTSTNPALLSAFASPFGLERLTDSLRETEAGSKKMKHQPVQAHENPEEGVFPMTPTDAPS
jgi:hypothetical protein